MKHFWSQIVPGHKSKHSVVTNRAAVTNRSESQIVPSKTPGFFTTRILSTRPAYRDAWIATQGVYLRVHARVAEVVPRKNACCACSGVKPKNLCKSFYLGVWWIVMNFLAHHLQWYFQTHLRYTVSPWGVFQLATLLVPWEIIYVELTAAFYQGWIEPWHRAIKINNSWERWYRIHTFWALERKLMKHVKQRLVE